jgi:voltage-gated potassium channel
LKGDVLNLISRWRSFAKFDFDSDRFKQPVGGTPLTQRLFRVLYRHDPSDDLTRIVDRSIIALIVISTSLNLFVDVQQSETFLAPLVVVLDWVATIALTIELCVKWAIADLDPRLAGLKHKRLRFILRPLSIMDLVVLIPSWLSLFFPLHLFFVQFFRILRLAELVHPLMSTINIFIRETRGLTLRKRTHIAFFGGERDHGIPGIVDFLIFAVILISVALMTLESIEWLREKYKPKFNALDMIVTLVFILEYMARLYCCVENPRFRSPVFGRIRYMLTGGALIDLVAIAPFFLSFIWPTPVPWLWALRLLRMLKLGRYSPSVSTIMSVVREERAVLSAAIMMLFLLTMFAASGIYVAEHAAQPEKFSSIPVSMYWAVVTLTSIGYGDYYPITTVGQILTMILAIAGLGMIALPAGILANGFSQKIKTNHKPRNKTAHLLPVQNITDGNGPEMGAISYSAETSPHEDFRTMDQILRSTESRRKLNLILEPLSHGEREALIALAAISLKDERKN